VSNGANIVDQDFFEALGFRHFNMCATRMFSLAKTDRKCKGAFGLRLS